MSGATRAGAPPARVARAADQQAGGAARPLALPCSRAVPQSRHGPRRRPAELCGASHRAPPPPPAAAAAAAPERPAPPPQCHSRARLLAITMAAMIVWAWRYHSQSHWFVKQPAKLPICLRTHMQWALRNYSNLDCRAGRQLGLNCLKWRRRSSVTNVFNALAQNQPIWPPPNASWLGWSELFARQR